MRGSGEVGQVESPGRRMEERGKSRSRPERGKGKSKGAVADCQIPLMKNADPESWAAAEIPTGNPRNLLSIGNQGLRCLSIAGPIRPIGGPRGPHVGLMGPGTLRQGPRQEPVSKFRPRTGPARPASEVYCLEGLEGRRGSTEEGANRPTG